MIGYICLCISRSNELIKAIYSNLTVLNDYKVPKPLHICMCLFIAILIRHVNVFISAKLFIPANELSSKDSSKIFNSKIH